MTLVPISMAGLSILVELPDNVEFCHSSMFDDFRVTDIPACPDIEVKWHQTAHLSDLQPERLIYDPGEVWRLYSGDNDSERVVDIYYGENAIRARMVVNADWSKADFAEVPNESNSATMLCYGGTELLIRTHIIAHSGVVLHASGIDDRGRGVLFVGHSGAGKSTQALMWAHHTEAIPLNDDRIAVRTDDQATTMFGLPWGGTAGISRNLSVPLHGIVMLEQAEQNVISEVQPSEAVKQLMARTFLPYWDAGILDGAMDTLQNLVVRVPVLRLRCRPEPAVIELVRSALR